MKKRLVLLSLAGVLLAVGWSWWPPGPRDASAAALVSPMGDREFWRLASGFSEPDGTFHSENLVSNEAAFQTIIPDLQRAVVPGRAYLGVGSEQNFTYIAATRPTFGFIVDIRRENFDLQLAYKALFELSADRAEFVSRLFSRKRPAGLGPSSSAAAIFSAYERVAPSRDLYQRNLEAIVAQLATTHGFGLSRGDRQGIEFVYDAWFRQGPDIHYELTTGGFGRGGGFPTYADLMTAADSSGQNRSYLATESSFKFVKDLETRNMLVPVVGNFGGRKALRAVASYLTQAGLTVSAFYVSNVEQYLRQDGLWGEFCRNASALPVDGSSMFIRSTRGGGGFALALAPIAREVASCASR